jgi:hypothetical protein
VKTFPRLAKVQQCFDASHIEDVEADLQESLRVWQRKGPDLQGRSIAITAGSRGIGDITLVLRALIAFLKGRGADPFLVPAMGSHGGANEAGQEKILADYGITEDALGVPLRNSMSVVEVGRTTTGLPVFCDQFAASAQGIVVVNRIKDHTDFEGKYESGLAKMLVIGLGKHKGAMWVHSRGIRAFREELGACAQVSLKGLPVLFGIGIVENGYGETAILEVIDGPAILERETGLLDEAKRLRSRILLDELDVLVVREMGKDISGTGMDTRVIGRREIYGEAEPDTPRIKRICVLGLSEGTRGNAVGIGLADICTRRLVKEIDFEATYINTITATHVERAKIPLTAETDRDAIDIAMNTCWVPEGQPVRMAIIKNTKSLDAIWLTEGMLPSLRGREDLRVLEPPAEMRFDPSGSLILQ